MSEPLPLFPLGTVLFPGLVLPLHVFEPRYRTLVQELLSLPESARRFGVVAIRQGHEVGHSAVAGRAALHDVGCVAQVRQVQAHGDGRYDLLTVGTRRFALGEVNTARPWFTGAVDVLPELVGDHAEAVVLAQAVAAALQEHLVALSGAGVSAPSLQALPADPLVLGYAVAAAASMPVADRQELLAEPDGRARLRHELSLLRRETGLLRALSAIPDPGLVHTPPSPN